MTQNQSQTHHTKQRNKFSFKKYKKKVNLREDRKTSRSFKNNARQLFSKKENVMLFKKL